MSKWSLFYLTIPVIGVVIFAIAPWIGWDLPENVSTFGRQIDILYYGILWLTGIVFIITQAFLIYIIFRFGHSRRGTQRAHYSHGSRTLEVLWTVIPSAVLLFIALFQMPTYVAIRFPSSKPDIPPTARVWARQFEWRIVYPGPDGQLDTPDDIHVPNELHIVQDRRVLVDLRSMDVLHSFFLPNLRIKQDAVPGLAIPVWFDALKSTRQFQSKRTVLEPEDFRDLGGLALKLRDENSAIASHLRGLWTADDRQMRELLREYDGERQPAAPLRTGIIAFLNRVVAGPNLYDAARFEGIKLSADTQANLAANPTGAFVNLLNRQLLHDAFPNEMKENRHQYDLVCAELCGWGHYKMKGRLTVHETQAELDQWLAERRAEQEASK